MATEVATIGLHLLISRDQSDPALGGGSLRYVGNDSLFLARSRRNPTRITRVANAAAVPANITTVPDPSE
jgi:hypothetical protein